MHKSEQYQYIFLRILYKYLQPKNNSSLWKSTEIPETMRKSISSSHQPKCKSSGLTDKANTLDKVETSHTLLKKQRKIHILRIRCN